MGDARSLTKLNKWAEANGIRNPVTGKPPSKVACYKAMWRWASLKENQRKAYEIAKEALAHHGELEWDEFIEHIAYRCKDAFQYPRRKLLKYFKDNELPLSAIGMRQPETKRGGGAA